MVGRARLHRVALGHVLVDRLADLAGDQPVDQQLGADERRGHGEAGGEEEGYHPAGLPQGPQGVAGHVPVVEGRSASSPTICTASWPLPAITTTSPGRRLGDGQGDGRGAGRARR